MASFTLAIARTLDTAITLSFGFTKSWEEPQV
jgi:hypothetical protein